MINNKIVIRFLIFSEDKRLIQDLNHCQLKYHPDTPTAKFTRKMFCYIDRQNNNYMIMPNDNSKTFEDFHNEIQKRVKENKYLEFSGFDVENKIEEEQFLYDLLTVRDDISKKFKTDLDHWFNAIITCPIALCCVEDNAFTKDYRFLGNNQDLNPIPFILLYELGENGNPIEKEINNFLCNHDDSPIFRKRYKSFWALADDYTEKLRDIINYYKLDMFVTKAEPKTI